MEQSLWFFRLPEGAQDKAVQVAEELADRKPPSVAPLDLPVERLLAALQKKFRKLRVDVKAKHAEVDLPRWETFVSLSWTSTHFHGVFEGDGEKAMIATAAAFAEFGCGSVYGSEYFPPSAPYGSNFSYHPDIEAFIKIAKRLKKEFEKAYPDDPEKCQRELGRALASPETKRDIDRLGDELEAKYRATRPPEIVARTDFIRTPSDYRKVRSYRG